MAYKTKRRTRRQPKKKEPTTWYNKKYSVGEIANKAWTTAKYVASMINVEYKKHDVYNASLAITASGTVQPLSLIPVGDAANERTGNSIKATGLMFKALLANSGAVDDTATTLMLVRDNQQVSDATPSVTDIITLGYGHFAVLNRDTAGRFTVLWKKTYTQDISRKTTQIDDYIKQEHHIRFNGNAAADIQKGGYYLLAISNKAANAPTMTFLTRVTYVDN